MLLLSVGGYIYVTSYVLFTALQTSDWHRYTLWKGIKILKLYAMVKLPVLF